MKVRPLLINSRLHIWKKVPLCFRLWCRFCLQLSVYTSLIIRALFWTNGPSEIISNNWNHPIASALFRGLLGSNPLKALPRNPLCFLTLFVDVFSGWRFSAGCGPSCDFHWRVAGGDDHSKTKRACVCVSSGLVNKCRLFSIWGSSVLVIACTSEREGALGGDVCIHVQLIGVSGYS